MFTLPVTLLPAMAGGASQALACAVCGLGQDESSMAFFRGTMLLSLVPLGMLGGIIYYLYRRTRAAVQVEVAERP